MQWISLVVGTSAGERLISTRTFAVTKCSARLLSKDTPVSQAPRKVTLNSATISYRTNCRRLLTDNTQKTPGLQKPSVPNIMGRRNKRAGMSAYGQGGGQRVASELPRAPGDYISLRNKYSCF